MVKPVSFGVRWQAKRDTAFASSATLHFWMTETGVIHKSAVAASLCQRTPK